MLETYITKDGSPTLIFKRTANDESYEEKMHHSEGAWTETVYIYLPALEIGFRQSPNPSVLSLGLGLGYNELMTCALLLKSFPSSPLTLHSYEALSELREEFAAFILNGRCKKYQDSYETVLNKVASHFSLAPKDLRLYTNEKLEKGELRLLGAFPKSLPPRQKYNVFLYDAFSNKMDPELWTEDFLKQHISLLAEDEAVLSTYAATGALKRALRSIGFDKLIRPGFSGKRDSSFYIRGWRDDEFRRLYSVAGKQ